MTPLHMAGVGRICQISSAWPILLNLNEDKVTANGTKISAIYHIPEVFFVFLKTP